MTQRMPIIDASDDYSAWCIAHGCTHGHCPDGCEHPQPRRLMGRFVCGRCAVKHGELVDMVPCGPDLCEA